MARADITQTFDAEANCRSITLSVTYDALDSPESLEECVTRAAVLWHVMNEDE